MLSGVYAGIIVIFIEIQCFDLKDFSKNSFVVCYWLVFGCFIDGRCKSANFILYLVCSWTKDLERKLSSGGDKKGFEKILWRTLESFVFYV